MARWFLALGLGLLISACATVERADLEAAKQDVSQRARERWDLVRKGEVDKAYEYFSPASRSTLSLEAFRRRGALGRGWRAVELEKVDCGPDTCQVTGTLEYDLRDIKGLKRAVEETWIKDAGAWWLVAPK